MKMTELDRVEGCFYVKDKLSAVVWKERVLVFSPLPAGNADCDAVVPSKLLLLKDILSVRCEGGVRPYVRIHYVVPHSNKRLRCEICDLHGDETTCKRLSEVMQRALNDLTRPKRLLVFVNPKSGHKKGVKVYTSKVAPLLQLSGIHTELIVTDRAGQPHELLSTYDLRLIHGIVSVGGDGMFSECVNGLLTRLQEDSHIDRHDPDADIVASKIPIGIVPAGSGNYLVNYIHGTRDIETAVLKIILGDHHLSNVVGLHQGRQLTCYASLLVEFGLVGNMMHDCEKFRWLGPSRYSMIPVTTLARRKPVDVQIEYVPEETKRRSPKPRLPNYLRQVSLPANHKLNNRHARNRLNSTPEYESVKNRSDWKKLEGRVYGVDTYVVTQKEKGEGVVPRFGDNALTMWLTDKCSMGEHVKQLTKIQKGQSGFLDYDFIRQVRTTRYRVKLSSAKTDMDETGTRRCQSKFYINVDGEAIRLETPEFEVRLHQCAMPIYGTIES